jgi:hypothetical protein
MPLTAKQNRLSLVNAYRKAARGNPRLQLLRLTTERVRSLLPTHIESGKPPFFCLSDTVLRKTDPLWIVAGATLVTLLAAAVHVRSL